jgi:hypothetical protein
LGCGSFVYVGGGQKEWEKKKGKEEVVINQDFEK